MSYVSPPARRFPARAVYKPPFRPGGMTGNRLLPFRHEKSVVSTQNIVNGLLHSVKIGAKNIPTCFADRDGLLWRRKGMKQPLVQRVEIKNLLDKKIPPMLY